MNLKTLTALIFVACIAAVVRAQVPALSSLSSLYESEVAASRTKLASSASSAMSRISSEIQRSSESAASQSATTTNGAGAGTSTNGNDNNGASQTGGNGQATAASTGSSNSGTSNGMSAFTGLSNVMVVQAVAWSALFAASFAAMFM
ncbi:hypothetical protein BDB00DRAFT_843229 [Zychaea mexicana]|uniref:uncharacterized protein n=1 Tax=Zychaea mexicana TaxID=64656 RepID=UPI0022FF14CE|nr:uncharacterized protein BDB00DRAFT_843229 [Zychaea mexicana]KAI9489395.1 hypothetical protein BDB00DRAFT_843229 [Zychaea mexicana]